MARYGLGSTPVLQSFSKGLPLVRNGCCLKALQNKRTGQQVTVSNLFTHVNRYKICPFQCSFNTSKLRGKFWKQTLPMQRKAAAHHEQTGEGTGQTGLSCWLQGTWIQPEKKRELLGTWLVFGVAAKPFTKASVRGDALE